MKKKTQNRVNLKIRKAGLRYTWFDEFGILAIFSRGTWGLIGGSVSGVASFDLENSCIFAGESITQMNTCVKMR